MRNKVFVILSLLLLKFQIAYSTAAMEVSNVASKF